MPKAGLRKIARYPNDFKVQAVQLSSHPDIQNNDVAQALDIHPFMLSRWRKEYREGKDRKSTRLNSSHIQKSRMPSSA